MTIKTVCVYCSSSNHVDVSFKTGAETVARLLARSGYDFVYGGGHIGLMGIVAETALKEGSKVTGVFIEHLESKEKQQEGLTELHVVPSMHERKALMAEKADAFLVLPGGLGTLDEVFEIITWKQLGFHQKPIIFFNQNNFWDPAFALMNHIVEAGFAPANNKKIYKVTDKPEEILTFLKEPEETIDYAEGKWQ